MAEEVEISGGDSKGAVDFTFDEGVVVFIVAVVVFLCDKDAEVGEDPIVLSDDVLVVCRDSHRVELPHIKKIVISSRGCPVTRGTWSGDTGGGL